MAKFRRFLFLGLILICGRPATAAPTPAYPAQLRTFARAKERQERQLAAQLQERLPAEVASFFQSARRGDYPAMADTVARLGAQIAAGYEHFTNGLPAWLPFWQPMTEVETGYELFVQGGNHYPLALGEGIIQSLPKGSIYFGGTDAGRMLVTVLSADHAQGKPFYTLTQNALADDQYMNYLRGIYGHFIHLPTTNELAQIQADYEAEALRRWQHDRQSPGEPHQVAPSEQLRLVNGRLRVQGPVSVMAMSARVVKWILEHNPRPEFYYEESYPQELLFPYLSPHGLVFELHHEPLAAWSVAQMNADHDYWTSQCGRWLGNWPQPNTPVADLCARLSALHGPQGWPQFAGDRAFVTNAFAPRAFSKLRVAIAGLYQWRLAKPTETEDRWRLQYEASYAYRQAYALDPTSPEVMYRFVNFLTTQSQVGDAIRVAQTTLALTPENSPYHHQYELLLAQLKPHESAAAEP